MTSHELPRFVVHTHSCLLTFERQRSHAASINAASSLLSRALTSTPDLATTTSQGGAPGSDKPEPVPHHPPPTTTTTRPRHHGNKWVATPTLKPRGGGGRRFWEVLVTQKETGDPLLRCFTQFQSGGSEPETTTPEHLQLRPQHETSTLEPPSTHRLKLALN